CVLALMAPQPTAQYGQMLAVCFAPSSLRRAARCAANATLKPSPASCDAATPAEPMPVSLKTSRLEVARAMSRTPSVEVTGIGATHHPSAEIAGSLRRGRRE